MSRSLASLFSLAALSVSGSVSVSSETPLSVSAQLFGGGPYGGLVKISGATGKMINESPPRKEEETGQELATIDKKRGIYYIIGYNATSGKPNLYGWNLKTHKVEVDMDLPFQESGFVGVGQAIDADPVTGDLFVVGRPQNEPSNSSTHELLRLHHNSSFKTHSRITSLQGIDILDGSSAYDHVNGVEHIAMLASGTPPKIYFDILAVDVKTGHITKIPMDATKGDYVTDLDFDELHGRMYGIGIDIKNGNKKALVYYDAKTHKFSTVGDFPAKYGLQDGNLVTLDEKERVFYSMLGVTDAPNVTHWKHSDKCTGCKGASEQCCYDPDEGPSTYTCFGVTNCSSITNGGGPPDLTKPIHLVGLHADTGAVLTEIPSVCAIITNGSYPACPWSFDSLL